MKRAVLFIHGAGGFQEDQPLAKNLKHHLGDGFHVLLPEMPDADEPSYAAWQEEIVRHVKALNNPVLVGHSLGGPVLLKTLTETPFTCAGLFLLAAPYWGAPDWEAKEYELPAHFAAKLPPDMPVHLYHSRDDDVVPFEHLSLNAAKLPQAHVHRFKVRGHQFNDDLSEMARDIKKVLQGEPHA